jgi:hypothetical protein
MVLGKAQLHELSVSLRAHFTLAAAVAVLGLLQELLQELVVAVTVLEQTGTETELLFR